MPTTLSGLLLFAVLLLPGFAYLVGKERAGTERRTSPFRETVAIVAASMTSNVAVLLMFAAVRALWPGITPDIGALVTNGSAYAPLHYRELAAWGVGLLIAASAISYGATMPTIRGRLPGTYPHQSTVSAWWRVFEEWDPEATKHVGLALDDGSWIEGRLASFNASADDLPDRDLILTKPLKYRGPDANEVKEYKAFCACVSARRISAMFVTYLPEDWEDGATSSEGAAEAASALA